MKIPENWTEVETGGNCTAWQRDYHAQGKHVAYALLTQAGDPIAPENKTDRVAFGLYSVETDRQLVAFEFARVSDALRASDCVAFIEESEVL